MNISEIPSHTKIQPISHEIYLQGIKDTGVLLLHGFTGSPHDMKYLAGCINENGYTVYVPRYPGHGTNSEDFMTSDWKDWLRKAVDSYIFMKSKYEKVIVGGLSMGGVIASIIAEKFPVEKLLLYAPALMASDSRIKISGFLGIFMKKVRKNEITDYGDKYLNSLAEEYWNWNYPKQAYSLYKLQKMAVKNLSKINTDIFLVMSEKDTDVPFRVNGIIKSKINNEKISELILKESGHVVTNDKEKETVALKTVEYLNNI